MVFDQVYIPFTTKLLEIAESRGCRVARGLDMFVAQGAEQFRIWTGQPAPVDLMRSVVAERLRERTTDEE